MIREDARRYAAGSGDWRLGSNFSQGGTSRTLGLGAGHDLYFPNGGRAWHWGMSFRFILFPWRHHEDFRVWWWGMRIRKWHRRSFTVIIRLQGLQVISGKERRYKWDTRRCWEVQQDARRCEVIRVDTKRCVEIRGWHQGKSFSFIFVLGRHPQDFRAGGGA